MRALLILLPAALLAQTPSPAPKSTSAPKAAPSTPSAAKSTAPGAKSTAPAPGAAAGMTDDQKTIYAIGLNIYKSISGFNFSPAELELVKRGMSDASAGKPAVSLEAEGPKFQGLFVSRNKAAGAAFLAKAAAQPGAVKTATGLVYKEERAGTGPSPKLSDTVVVNYRGTFIDGTEFDSSYKSNRPAPLKLSGVIPCWTEGLQRMRVGGKANLVCPYQIAYGEAGGQGIPPAATLNFEVELLGLNPPAAK